MRILGQCTFVVSPVVLWFFSKVIPPDYGLECITGEQTVLAALTDGFAGEEPGEPQAETLEKKRA